MQLCNRVCAVTPVDAAESHAHLQSVRAAPRPHSRRAILVRPCYVVGNTYAGIRGVRRTHQRDATSVTRHCVCAGRVRSMQSPAVNRLVHMRALQHAHALCKHVLAQQHVHTDAIFAFTCVLPSAGLPCQNRATQHYLGARPSMPRNSLAAAACLHSAWQRAWPRACIPWLPFPACG